MAADRRLIPAQRRVGILRELEKGPGGVSVRALAADLGVSALTVRRDLDYLEEIGDVVRVRGGAMRRGRGTSFEPPWAMKVHAHSEQKRRIGLAVARRVSPGDTLFLDSGSTALWVARALTVPCTVIVGDVKIAAELGDRDASSGIETLVLAGTVRRGVFSTVGTFATQMLRQLRADWSFLGADAIDIAAGVTNATVEEVAIKQEMIARGQTVVLMADSSKLGNVALAQVATLDAFSVLVTDSEAEHAQIDQVTEAGLQVEQV